ncbi:MAG: beta-glucanase [Kiritimatiellales bacterium]|nr:beta-glucanase [Kiritimatiellales bacterium]
MTIKILLMLTVAAFSLRAEVLRPFPQADVTSGYGLRPNHLTQIQLSSAITNKYNYWKSKYLAESVSVPGDYKVKYKADGQTVSEAMGYGMLLTVYMAGADTNAQVYFDGLNRFRKRYSSIINPALMCWQVPANEVNPGDDCATDGDIDMAMALLLAHRQWGGEAYFSEATNLIYNIGASLVRSDYSLRLGDWNTAAGQTRPCDFMPTHFRSFYLATGDGLWTNVENKCYSILEQLQSDYAPTTGLIPDFAVTNASAWKPAPANFLEGPQDGYYYYNACRVPWRIGWAAYGCGHSRAGALMSRLMAWTVSYYAAPADFRAGYELDGGNISGNNYDTACFISPTGVGAMVTTNQSWLNSAFTYAANRKEAYYEDSVSLLSMLVMSGNAWLIEPASPAKVPPDAWLVQYYGTTNIDVYAFSSNGVNTILQAYIAGLDPNNPSSFLRLTSPRPLIWNSASGRVYNVYWTSNMLRGFQILETNYVGGVFTDTVHGAEGQGFYKIEVKIE